MTTEYEAITESEWKDLATTEITHLTDEEKDYLPRAWDEWIARVRRDAAEEVGQYIKRHHPDGLIEKTTVLAYIDTAADRLGRGIHANGRDRETP